MRDMREQTYPPKRPNMAHFDGPQEPLPRGEGKALPTPDGKGEQNEPRRRTDETPAR